MNLYETIFFSVYLSACSAREPLGLNDTDLIACHLCDIGKALALFFVYLLPFSSTTIFLLHSYLFSNIRNDIIAYGSKKHLKNVGPIRHNEPTHANSPGVVTVLSHAACASMSTTTTTTTTTRDRGDRYGPMEWAQLAAIHETVK